MSATPTGSVGIYGAQIEAAAFASSYIPTTTGAVTRNAEAESWPTAGNFLDAQGTAYCEVTYSDWANASGAAIGDGTESPILPAVNVSGVQAYDGTNTASGQAGVPSGTVKMAVRWSGSTMSVWANGVKGPDATYDGAFSLASIGIGNGLFATIRNVRIWTSALSDAQIAAI